MEEGKKILEELVRRSILALLMAVMFAALVVAGCTYGGGDDSSSVSSSSDAGTASPPDPEDVGEDTAPKQKKQSKEESVDVTEVMAEMAANGYLDKNDANTNPTDLIFMPGEFTAVNPVCKDANGEFRKGCDPERDADESMESDGEEKAETGQLTPEEVADANAAAADANATIEQAGEGSQKTIEDAKKVLKDGGWPKSKDEVKGKAQGTVAQSPAPTNYKFALVDNGSAMTNANLQTIKGALEQQMNNDLAANGSPWGGSTVTIYVYDSVAAFQSANTGAWPIYYSDDCCNSGDGDGWHSESSGIPYGEIDVSDSGSASGNSRASSHELLEMVSNPLPGSSLHYVTYSGYIYMLEMADPVWGQPDAYTRNGVSVSDWVYPWYFWPGYGGPWSYNWQALGVLNPSCDWSGFQIYKYYTWSTWQNSYCH